MGTSAFDRLWGPDTQPRHQPIAQAPQAPRITFDSLWDATAAPLAEPPAAPPLRGYAEFGPIESIGTPAADVARLDPSAALDAQARQYTGMSLAEQIEGRLHLDSDPSLTDEQRELIRQRIAAGGLEPPAGPMDPVGEFQRAFLGTMAGQNVQATGAFLRSVGLEGIGRKIEEYGDAPAEANQRLVPSASDVERTEDLVNYVPGAIAQALASSIPSLVTGAAGFVAGGPPGAVAGALVPSYILNTGEVQRELDQLGQGDRGGLALLLGAPIAALDAFTPADVVTRLMSRGVAREAAEQLATTAAERGLIARVGAQAARSGVMEAGTEAAQETIQYGGTRGGTGQPIDPAELAQRVQDAAIAGGLGGAVLGGGSQLLGAARTAVSRETASPPRSFDQAWDAAPDAPPSAPPGSAPPDVAPPPAADGADVHGFTPEELVRELRRASEKLTTLGIDATSGPAVREGTLVEREFWQRYRADLETELQRRGIALTDEGDVAPPPAPEPSPTPEPAPEPARPRQRQMSGEDLLARLKANLEGARATRAREGTPNMDSTIRMLEEEIARIEGTPPPVAGAGPIEETLRQLQARLRPDATREDLEQLRADITTARSSQGAQPIYSELSVLQGKVTRAIKKLDPPPAPKKHELGPPADGPIGADTQVMLHGGQQLPARYRVIEASALRSSHDPFTFAPTEGYPVGIQGRDYQRNKAAQETVRARALDFNAEMALNPSTSATEGQPTILPDGTVIAGNERSMHPRLAAQLAPAKYQAYRTALEQRAQQFGIDVAQVQAMQQPVLVRELTSITDLMGGPQRWAELNRLSDVTATKAKSQVEEGAARAAKLQQARDGLRHFAETIGADETVSQYLGTADGRAFVKHLLDAGVITKEELGRFTSGEGVLTGDGREAIRQMLLNAAVRDPAALLDAPPLIVGKLEHAVPNIVALRGTTYDPSGVVTAALRALGAARAQGLTLKDFGGQGDLLGGDRAGFPPLVLEFAGFLENKSKMAISQAFRRFATLAREALEAESSVDMFGGTGWDPPSAFREAFELSAEFDGELAAPKRRRGPDPDELRLFTDADDTPLFAGVDRPDRAPEPPRRSTSLRSDALFDDIDRAAVEMRRRAEARARGEDPDQPTPRAEPRPAPQTIVEAMQQLADERGKFTAEEVSERPQAVQAEESDIRGGRTEYAPGQQDLPGFEAAFRRQQRRRDDQGELLSPAGPNVAAPRAGRPYTLEELDGASARQLQQWLAWEERLAMRELLDREGTGDPVAPAAGAPSKTIAELVTLEHELRAAEKKLSEVQSSKLKQILEAQVYNRTRQQEAYVREYFAAGREGELPPEVRDRFPGIGKEAKGERGQQHDERARARAEWERQMRERAERARQDRERREREERERRASRGSGRRTGPPPPPPPRASKGRRGKGPPPPSMKHARSMTPPTQQGTPVLSLIRIGRMLEQALGTKAYQGRFRQARRALGIFKVSSEAIRLTRHEWLDVRAHEVGHFISKRYLGHPTSRKGPHRYRIPPTAKAELEKMGRNLYGSRRPGLGYGEEGIAEWAKFYVTDPARMWHEAPEFTKWMESVAFRDTPLLEEALGKAREHYAKYRAATPLERIKAQRAPKGTRFRMPSIRALIRTWLDDTEEIRRFDLAVRERGGHSVAHELAKLSRGAAGVADNWLKFGMVDLRDNRRTGSSVADVLAAVGTNDLDDFEAYLMAESALERWEHGINPGIERADAQAVVKDLAPKFRKHAEAIWKHYTLLLQARRDAGMLSADGLRRIHARNQRHVGFYRLFEDYELPASGSGRPRGLLGGGLKAQHGSSREIISPLESIVKDTHDTASAIARYRVGHEIIRAALDVEGLGPLVDEVPAPIEPVEIHAPDVFEQLRALGLVKIDPITGDPVKLERDDLIGEVLTTFREIRRPGQKELKDLVIPFEKNGVRRWFQIGDRALDDTLQGLGPQGLPEWARLAGKPVRALRAGVTLTVRFILKNLVRDASTAFIRTRSTRWVLPYEHLVTGIFTYFRRPELLDRWQLEGGDNATLQGVDRMQTELAVRRYARQGSHAGRVVDIVRHPVDTIRMLGSIGENLTRLGEFAIVERQALKRGAGPREAAREGAAAARDVTQDFSVAGVGGRAVNQLVVFFNPHVNSVANLVRDLRNRPHVVLPRIAAGVTLPSLWLAIAQHDDEEYQRIPRWQKDIFWIYIQRNERGEVEHRWFIPKPFEIGVLFGSIPERIAEFILTKDPRAFDQTWESIKQAVIPNYLPPTLQTGIELYANRDTFRDRPIVPRALERLDAREQAGQRTGETARVIGGAFPGEGISPAKIEHAIRGHTGTLGMAALQASDAAIRAFRELAGMPPLRERATVLRPDAEEDPLVDVPGVSAFVGRAPMENAEDLDRIHRAYEDAERRRLTWLHMMRDGRRFEAATYLRQNLAAIRSVATREMTGDQPGPLRMAYEGLSKVRKATRAVPENRVHNVGLMHAISRALETATAPEEE